MQVAPVQDFPAVSEPSPCNLRLYIRFCSLSAGLMIFNVIDVSLLSVNWGGIGPGILCSVK